MQFKGIQAMGRKVYNIDLPDKKSIVLDGMQADKDYILELLKIIFGMDYNNSLHGDYNCEEMLRNNAVLQFTGGKLRVEKGAISISGKIPYIHCVYAGNDGITSFLISQSVKKLEISTDMTEFSNIIDMSDWTRLIELFNRYAGFKCAYLVDSSEVGKILQFDGLTKELETVWLLMSESFLTPTDYLRIVLIPQLSLFSAEDMFRLIELLDNIHRLEMVITSAEVDIKPNSVITRVSC